MVRGSAGEEEGARERDSGERREDIQDPTWDELVEAVAGGTGEDPGGAGAGGGCFQEEGVVAIANGLEYEVVTFFYPHSWPSVSSTRRRTAWGWGLALLLAALPALTPGAAAGPSNNGKAELCHFRFSLSRREFVFGRSGHFLGLKDG